MNIAIGISCLALTVGLWFFFETRRINREFEFAMHGRDALSAENFYARFYGNSGIPFDTVAIVRQVLEDELQVDVSRFVPTDDFSRNLRFLLDSDSMMDVAIVEGLEKCFGISISDEEAIVTLTLDNIVNLVHKKTSDRHLHEVATM